jgi:hypothetical protein
MNREDRLSVRLDHVLEALRKAGDWTPRSQLASTLGRKRLNTTDLEALAVLEATGRIEVDRRADNRPIGYMVYYRVKP